MSGSKILCINLESAAAKGELILPQKFLSLHGHNIPNKVSLQIPNGDIWPAMFRSDTKRIIGLGGMMKVYELKPYYIFVLEFVGVAKFNMEIFTNDAVEIKYSSLYAKQKNPRISRFGGGKGNQVLAGGSTMELEQTKSKFFYNTMKLSRMSYDIIITTDLLRKDLWKEVLSLEGCSKLGLNNSMTYIQIGFQTYKWLVNLKWENTKLLFDNQWAKFTEEASIRVGDICVLSRTTDSQKFKITVLENQIKSNIRKRGEALNEMKCLRIVTDDMLAGGGVELPRKFMALYGSTLNDRIDLLMADGLTFTANFCCVNKIIFGLKELFKAYSIKKSYFLFFHFVGDSTFEITIFSKSLMSICNRISNEEDISDSSDDLSGDSDSSMSTTDSSSVYGLVNSIVSSPTNSDAYSDTSMSTDDSDSSNYEINNEPSVEVQMLVENPLRSFTVCLKPSHVDQKGHGVYCPRYLFSAYQRWRNGTVVTVRFGNKEWKVAMNRRLKICRFGLGWDNFTHDNSLTVGMKLQFFYDDNMGFNVRAVE